MSIYTAEIVECDKCPDRMVVTPPDWPLDTSELQLRALALAEADNWKTERDGSAECYDCQHPEEAEKVLRMDAQFCEDCD